MKKTLGTMVAIMVVAILIGTFNTSKYATAGEIGRDGRFIAYDNGTVLDERTNLMWAAEDNGKHINWAEAKSYCENFRGGGYIDWRMPTLYELTELYDKNKVYYNYVDGKKTLEVHLTGLICLTSWYVWALQRRGSHAVVFNFYDGGDQGRWVIWAPQSHAASYRALPVRSIICK